MRIKNIFVVLLVMLLPILGIARDTQDFEATCDNIVFNEAYNLYHGKEDTYALQYALGEPSDRGKFNDELKKWYCIENDCWYGSLWKEDL